MAIFKHNQPFLLENGVSLPSLEIAYATFGSLNEAKDNIIWVCHALTANADPTDWWKGLVGKDCLINPDKYFIVGANIIGSCYGSTGPLSIDPSTEQPYYSTFPQVTIRDMVAAHILLRKYLGVDSIHLLMGGSMGGYQVIEWALMEPLVIKKIFLYPNP